ncbi:MAG: nitroreductase family protein [Nanoarchaeota archaeon]|nr:nitroreductase family protein [Nanoarchaeota archaeon]MBU0963374.1 nitroreductase family protein [Nanoarchaeota archaeon]
MELDKCIKERRSVRKYTNKKVSWSLISKILDSGVRAPSSGNIQNYNFIVVQNAKKREEIARAAGQLWMLESPVFIVICNNKDKIKKFYEEDAEHYSVQNCAASAQNMLLTAYSLGLSTCWVGSYDEIALQRILKLPDNVKLEMIITIGYSDIKIKEPKKFSVDRLTYFEEFGNTKK